MSAADADIEALLIGWLTARYPSARVLTELPANLADVLPVIQVGNIGGQDRFTLAANTVDIDCYDDTRITARNLAYQVWADLRFVLRGYTTAQHMVTRVDTINAPAWRPYDNTNLRRIGITVQVIVHTPTFAV